MDDKEFKIQCRGKKDLESRIELIKKVIMCDYIKKYFRKLIKEYLEENMTIDIEVDETKCYDFQEKVLNVTIKLDGEEIASDIVQL